jgi:hypothetical protein
MHWWLQSAGAETQPHPPTLGWDGPKIRKDRTPGKGRPDFALARRYYQNGFTTARMTIAAMRIAGISLIKR